ncbi:CU044_5270 family protein [Actinacidiphila glaucinigra]|uniref:CU044_5270 family protein n=1 Tax=Actinacidiphila glaucinigra TaxID=235986 RepID=UPI00380E119C
MTDEPELELLRRADPVPAGDPRWRDRPPDARVERGLRRLLAAEAASEAAAAPASRRTARRPGGLVAGLAAVAAAVVAVLVLVLSGAGTTPAVAAPVALRPLAGSREVPLADVAGAARGAAARGGGAGTRRGSHVMMWSMGMESGPGARPPVTLPEEHLTRWNPDGSGTELVVATDPRHPGEPVISDSGGAPRTVADGEVLHRAAYPPGTLPPYGRSGTEPPDSARELRGYLSQVYGCACAGTPALLDALTSLLHDWTPGLSGTAAVDELLAAAPGLRPAGTVTDRLGRHGQAYVHDAEGLRRMVVLDPVDGRVLGIEETFTQDRPEYRVKAGDVMSYQAWMD